MRLVARRPDLLKTIGNGLEVFGEQMGVAVEGLAGCGVAEMALYGLNVRSGRNQERGRRVSQVVGF